MTQEHLVGTAQCLVSLFLIGFMGHLAASGYVPSDCWPEAGATLRRGSLGSSSACRS